MPSVLRYPHAFHAMLDLDFLKRLCVAFLVGLSIAGALFVLQASGLLSPTP